jgi:demethylmenaquinone methyltransferase/2-methoxy-6-polyprenyl-1,4-benzoquinol methylase
LLVPGGGTGRFAKHFIPYVGETWILDPSIPMLKHAKKNHPSLKIIHGYADNIPLPDNYFDVIIIYDSLHHWQNHFNSMKELLRVLKKSGKLIIGEIHPRHKSGYFIMKMEEFFRMNSKFYKPYELKLFVENIGFSTTKIRWSRKPTYLLFATKK